MGVYIKDMEIPKGCGSCACGAYGECAAATPRKPLDKRYRWSADERPDWCPLVHVPPHGRLIDADTFRKEIRPITEKDDFNACTFRTVKELMKKHIDDAPTIILAEEGE